MRICVRNKDQDKLNLDYIIIGLKSGNTINGFITSKRSSMLHQSFKELDSNPEAPSIDQFDLFKLAAGDIGRTVYEVNRYYINITQIEYIILDESDYSLYLEIEEDDHELYAIGVGDDDQD